MTVRDLLTVVQVDTEYIWEDKEGAKSLMMWPGMLDREVLLVTPACAGQLMVKMDYRFGEAGI